MKPFQPGINTCGLLLIVFILGASCAVQSSTKLPDGFVYLSDIIPDIHLDIRYYGTNNFIGERIEGYLQPRAIMTRQAAQALEKVQQELEPFGLGLKIFDAYRPQRAVDHFVRWAKNLDDTRMKQQFYPDVEKQNLFKEDYIASKSSHSRGSTADLTIVSRQDGIELDMGSPYDFFSPVSWPAHQNISASQRANRMLLQSIMLKHGFNPYPKEWWHFTLADEPFPDRYFDFPVQ